MTSVPSGPYIAQIYDASDPDVKTSAMQAAPTKTTPVDADGVILIDSAASNAIKRTLWSSVKATLKTYFDTLYQAVLVSGTNLKSPNTSVFVSFSFIRVTRYIFCVSGLSPTGTTNFPPTTS